MESHGAGCTLHSCDPTPLVWLGLDTCTPSLSCPCPRFPVELTRVLNAHMLRAYCVPLGAGETTVTSLRGLPVLTTSSRVSQARLMVGPILVSIAIPHAISQGHQRANDSNGLGVICGFRRHFPHDRN